MRGMNRVAAQRLGRCKGRVEHHVDIRRRERFDVYRNGAQPLYLAEQSLERLLCLCLDLLLFLCGKNPL